MSSQNKIVSAEPSLAVAAPLKVFKCLIIPFHQNEPLFAFLGSLPFLMKLYNFPFIFYLGYYSFIWFLIYNQYGGNPSRFIKKNSLLRTEQRLEWLAEALSSLLIAGSTLTLGPNISPGGIYFPCSPGTLCHIHSMLRFSTSD
jgi:hypothetical protein